MKTLTLLVVLFASLAVGDDIGIARAAEQLDLTSPITTPNLTTWKVDEIRMSWSGARLQVKFLGSNGETKWCASSGEAAQATIRAPNKANLTTNSLHWRAIDWAKKLTPACLGAGSVSGSPD